MNSIPNDRMIATAREPLSDDQYLGSFLKQGIASGMIYQIKVLTWVAWKLLRRSDANVKNWYLGAEVRSARGFHDLVLKYEIDNPVTETENTNGAVSTRRVYRFVQVKHKMCLTDNVTINLTSLKSKYKKNQYSLIYLFKSYLSMLDTFERIKMEQVLDITVFTNVNIDSIRFLVPANDDPIFSFEGKGKRYRIDVDMIQGNPSVILRLREVMSNDEVIYDFLKKLVFAVDQPSEFELENWIVGEMGKVFRVPQIFYNDLYNRMTKWFLIYNNGVAPYLTEKLAMQYLLDAQMSLSAINSETFTEVSSLSKQLSEQLAKLNI